MNTRPRINELWRQLTEQWKIYEVIPDSIDNEYKVRIAECLIGCSICEKTADA